MKHLFLFPAALVSATPALAHEGHAAARELGVMHWLTEPDHLTVIALSAAVVLWIGVALRRSRRG